MYCIGLTGNIASGKSTAIACFQSFGVSVIIADNIAKELTSSSQPAFHTITNYFGAEVINKDGELDRALLRTRIFKDSQQRLWLENLLHPLIKETIKQKIAKASGPYFVIEIPLLKNKTDYPYLNRVLVILANQIIQVKRVMQRDHCTRCQALDILASQPNESQRINLADDIVFNNGSINQLTNRIKKLHEKYLQFASEKSS